jgi:hypothetical protein
MATCWNNGRQSPSGAGYGIKLTVAERDELLDRSHASVDLILPDDTVIQAIRCDKKSMWLGNCRELIHRDIGKWMLQIGLAPWPKGLPPRLKLEKDVGKRLKVSLF